MQFLLIMWKYWLFLLCECWDPGVGVAVMDAQDRQRGQADSDWFAPQWSPGLFDFTLCLRPERFRPCHHYAHQGRLCLPLIGLIALLIWTAPESFSNENRHVLIWHQELTCLLAWREEEAQLVITGAEPRWAVAVQLPSNSLEITVWLQWLLMRTNCMATELPWPLKTNGRCGNGAVDRENPINSWNRERLVGVGKGSAMGFWASKFHFPINVIKLEFHDDIDPSIPHPSSYLPIPPPPIHHPSRHSLSIFPSSIHPLSILFPSIFLCMFFSPVNLDMQPWFIYPSFSPSTHPFIHLSCDHLSLHPSNKLLPNYCFIKGLQLMLQVKDELSDSAHKKI